jgi:hypothetical protein
VSVRTESDWEHLAYKWMDKCEDEIKSWKGLGCFSLSLFKLDWSVRRRSSRGGIYGTLPGINIAMQIACTEYSVVSRVYEYKSFDSDRIIGGFYYCDANLKLGLHICHEMAHAAQFYRKFVLNDDSYDKPHGESFKKPYRVLRTKILNPLLEPQEPLKLEYESFIKKYNK